MPWTGGRRSPAGVLLFHSVEGVRKKGKFLRDLSKDLILNIRIGGGTKLWLGAFSYGPLSVKFHYSVLHESERGIRERLSESEP